MPWPPKSDVEFKIGCWLILRCSGRRVSRLVFHDPCPEYQKAKVTPVPHTRYRGDLLVCGLCNEISTQVESDVLLLAGGKPGWGPYDGVASSSR